MSLPIKTFWPTLAQSIYHTCRFIQTHQATILAVCASVDPEDLAAVEAALIAINGACSLFINVMQHVDPNWKPS